MSELAKRQLGRQLRRARERSRKTRDDVRTALNMSVTKIMGIEAGRSTVRPGDVWELGRLYELDDAAIEALTTLARATKAADWWEDFDDVLIDGIGLYLELEAAASEILAYDAERVHGLLHTPDYLAAMESVHLPSDRDRFTAMLRHRQQATFHRPEPCRLTLLIGQGALCRVVGSPETMTEQLDHLRETATQDHVQVRVLPWEVGVHPGLQTGPFTILGFDSVDDPDIVYVESPRSAHYQEQQVDLRAYRRVWATMLDLSVPIEEFR